MVKLGVTITAVVTAAIVVYPTPSQQPSSNAGHYEKTTGTVSGGSSVELVELMKQSDAETFKLRVTTSSPLGQPRVIEKTISGHYVYGFMGRSYGLHVLDLTGDGRDEIVVITSVGASLGASLTIFTVRDSQLVNLLKELVVEDAQFFIEHRPDGPGRVHSYGRWTNEETSTETVYEWDGKAFTARRVEGFAKSPPPNQSMQAFRP